MHAELLIGTFERQLDPKGRLALPSEMRKVLGERCYLVRGTARCVELVPADDFERQVRELIEAVRSGDKDMSERRAVAGSASLVVLDKQGRITVDEKLRTYAGLSTGDPVVVAGNFDRAEIWAVDRHQRIDAAGTERLAGDE